MQALIIDDARLMRMLLRLALEKLGFQVSEANNGREGLARLEDLASPAVVVVDWHMPEMDGLEFIRQVRATLRYAGLPLILITGEEDQAQVKQALDVGADATLGKPFTTDLIRERLSLLGVGGCCGTRSAC